MTAIQIKEMIQLINKSFEYKVTKRFNRVDSYNAPNDEKKSIGVFVDLETTGSNPNSDSDKIIGIALIPFEYTENGIIYKGLDSYTGFQDLKAPIPKLITWLTEITDEMVAGKTFDIGIVNQIASSTSIIIAHHAAFDKKFVEKIFPVFKDKLWGCTVAHIKWRQEDITSSKLE